MLRLLVLQLSSNVSELDVMILLIVELKFQAVQ